MVTALWFDIRALDGAGCRSLGHPSACSTASHAALPSSRPPPFRAPCSIFLRFSFLLKKLKGKRTASCVASAVNAYIKLNNRRVAGGRQTEPPSASRSFFFFLVYILVQMLRLLRVRYTRRRLNCGRVCNAKREGERAFARRCRERR